MSTGLRPRPTRPPDRDPTPPPVEARPPEPRDPDGGRELLLVPLLLLLATACLSLGRVFLGWGFLRPVLAAVLVVVGLSWGCRRAGAGPVVALAVSALGWTAFVAAVFLRDSTVLGVVPTLATVEAFDQLWRAGLGFIATRPAPTFAEPSLVMIAVTGVWALTHAVDGMVFRLHAPVKAILPALGLWLFPLLLSVGGGSPAVWAVPFLAASALLVLVAASTEVGRWGRDVRPSGSTRPAGLLVALAPPGLLIAAAAITLGVLLAASLPGFDDPPWYEFSGIGGTTLTTNPIVSIRPNLVASGEDPIMRVTTPRAVYLRTTALDVYSDAGEWTNAGIRGTPVSGDGGQMRAQSPTVSAQPLAVTVEVVNLPGAVLVPAPYEPREVTGTGQFQFDPRLATLTTERGATLQPGERYQVLAAVPAPDPGDLRSLEALPSATDVALPGNVPEEVVSLARRIVEDAGARTPFEQALALQQEFQSGRWEYSLDPPQGHSGDAMLNFIHTRIGYCEQYAGTMAVMLRSLGVPARVAVGFTPGEQVADGTYEVTNGNAHAWVEVHFPGRGWLSFEPTPRDDGNILPPTADNLAPALTVEQQAAAELMELPEAPVDDPAPLQEEVAPQDPEDPQATTGGATDDDDDTGATGVLIGGMVALLAVGAMAAAVLWRRRMALPPTSLARVLTARQRVETVGRGLGVPAVAWETDHEYLQRLTGTTTAPGAPATAVALARSVDQARYAPHLPDATAQEAEAAAGALRDALLAGRSAPGRAAVLVRGTVAAVSARLVATGRAAARRLRRG